MENNKMIVQIKDYQIIKRMNLEFIPGLNVIVGPSNNGKSSILKAIKALLYTTPGATPIRSGQSSYAVGINYNGHTVLLQKGLKESAYVVDGEKYTKFGVTTPPAVSEALQIKELELNGKKEQLNFWDQLNYPFLLDKTPVELFRFIVDSGDDDQITKALKNMVSDRQGLSRKIDQLQGTINAVDLDIDNYTDQLERAKPVLEACDKVIDLLPVVGRYNLLVDTKKVLDTIKIDKEVISKKLKDSNYSELGDISTRLKYVIDKHDLFSDYFIRLHNTIGDMSDIAEKLDNLKIIKNLKKIDTKNISELKDIRTILNNISNTRKGLRINPVIICNVSKEDRDKLNLLKNKLESLQYIKLQKDKNDDLKSNSEKDIIFYKDMKSLFKICPLCGNKIH